MFIASIIVVDTAVLLWHFSMEALAVAAILDSAMLIVMILGYYP